MSCDVCDTGMRLGKIWTRRGGTRCEEGVSIKGQSQCGMWSGEYWLRVHLAGGS